MTKYLIMPDSLFSFALHCLAGLFAGQEGVILFAHKSTQCFCKVVQEFLT